MIRNTSAGQTKNEEHEQRTSIESSVTFASLQDECLFDGAELVDTFRSNRNNSMSEASFGATAFYNEKRRRIENVHSSRETVFDGEKLKGVFEPHRNGGPPMGTAISSFGERRHSMKDSMMIDYGNETLPSHVQAENRQLAEQELRYHPPSASINDSMQRIHNSYNLGSKFSRDEDDEQNRIEYIDEIQPYDIICGRNNGSHNCVGNRRFRVTIMMNMRRYMNASTREDKTYVLKSVIKLLHEAGARFIKKVGDGKYVRLKDKQIREKVGHAFRDMISLSEKEASKAERNRNPMNGNNYRTW